MIQVGRSWKRKDYRFSFNGKEDESWRVQDYGFRFYDSKIARFLSVDPLKDEYAELTPYQFASNTPISCDDLDGLEANAKIYATPSRPFQDYWRFNKENAIAKASLPWGFWTAGPKIIEGYFNLMVYNTVNDAWIGLQVANPFDGTDNVRTLTGDHATATEMENGRAAILSVGVAGVSKAGISANGIAPKKISLTQTTKVSTSAQSNKSNLGVAKPKVITPTPVTKLTHSSGTAKPVVTGGTPNSVYTHLDQNGKAVQNAIYDAQGNVIAHIDFKNHGLGAPSGHGHTFPQPGNPASGHGAGKPHIPNGQLPADWSKLPNNVSPHTPIGQ